MRQRTRIVGRVGRCVGKGHIAGGVDEAKELTVSDRRPVDPEPVDRDVVRWCLLGVMPIRSHAECSARNPRHLWVVRWVMFPHARLRDRIPSGGIQAWAFSPEEQARSTPDRRLKIRAPTRQRRGRNPKPLRWPPPAKNSRFGAKIAPFNDQTNPLERPPFGVQGSLTGQLR
jgi:hypothetical protein